MTQEDIRMKKKIAILLITAMLTGMVTACGGNTDRSSDEVQTQTQDAEAMVHL